QPSQVLELDRLDQVVVEARLPGAAAVLLLPPAGQSHQQGAPAALLPDPPRRLVAIELRQLDVEEGEGRLQRPPPPNRPQAVVGGLDVVAQQAQQQGEAVGGVLVIVHDQDAPPRQGGWFLRGVPQPAAFGGVGIYGEHSRSSSPPQGTGPVCAFIAL